MQCFVLLSAGIIKLFFELFVSDGYNIFASVREGPFSIKNELFIISHNSCEFDFFALQNNKSSNSGGELDEK